ncbi:MAG: M15 family metallopeptidase [Pseudomonadota bacterium]
MMLALLSAPVGWYLAMEMADVDENDTSLSDLEEELAELEQKNKDLRIDLNVLTQRVVVLEEGGGAQATANTFADEDEVDTSDALADSFAQVVLIADRRNVNAGLTNSSSKFLISKFGLPREVLGQNCDSMTNPLLKDLVKTEDVGPIRVTMLEPAIVSLRQVFRNVKIFEPELYSRIASSGSLCVRNIRGTTGARPSTHAYGLSVDLNIDGQLDNFTDGKTQLGLVILADFFKKEGWYWGAGFGREDSMHFQVSKEKIDQWLRQGLIKAK